MAPAMGMSNSPTRRTQPSIVARAIQLQQLVADRIQQRRGQVRPQRFQ
jgi:hypothetical protein